MTIIVHLVPMLNEINAITYDCSSPLSRRVAAADVRLPPIPSPTSGHFHDGDDVEVNNDCSLCDRIELTTLCLVSYYIILH